MSSSISVSAMFHFVERMVKFAANERESGKLSGMR
jgi:hypothetical protein